MIWLGKSLSLYKNLFVLESTSYAQALSLLNQCSFLLEENIFEISPTPAGAVLILNLSNQDHFPFLQSQAEQLKDVRFQIFTDVPEKVVKAYLSQTEIMPLEHLACYETNSVVTAFQFAVTIVKQGFDIYDFRFLRASTHKCLVFSNATDSKISEQNHILLNVNPLVKGLFSN